jgi:hypothetical protein
MLSVDGRDASGVCLLGDGAFCSHPQKGDRDGVLVQVARASEGPPGYASGSHGEAGSYAQDRKES